jgi:hypothetical protein
MKKNIGKTDMTVRLVLAAVLVILYFFVGRITGLIFIILAIILAVTALTQTCPLYYIFRTDTLEKKE